MAVQRAVWALRTKMESLGRAGSVRSVGVLVGGTALGQALTALVLPLITRLYSPADFSVLAVYSSIVAIVSVAACLRLEIAIPLPESEQDAVDLLGLALCSCTLTAIIAGLAVWIYSAQIVAAINQPALRSYLWLLPIGIWLTSAYGAMQFWSTRRSRFGVIAKTRVTQAIAGAGAQIGLGWAGIAPFGLLLGYMISCGAGFINLARDAQVQHGAPFRRNSWAGMRRVLRLYSRFPKYSALEALANNSGAQIPILIIAASAAGPEAGYLLLAMRAMGAPLSLLGNSVSQVYLSRAPHELRTGRLAIFTAQTVGGLAMGGVGPLIFIGLVSPVLFPILFGLQWRHAGELVAWMTPWFVMQFMSSPVSMGLHVTGNQHIALLLQLLGLGLRVGTVIAAGMLLPTRQVELFALANFLFYAVYFFIVMRLAGVTVRNLWMVSKHGLRGVILWIAIAIAMVSTLRIDDMVEAIFSSWLLL